MTKTEQWLQKGLGVTAIILVLASSYAFARITWLLIAPESALPAGEAPMVATGITSRGPQQQIADLRSIKRWALFGAQTRQTSKRRATPEPTIKAPETKLNLDLKGVFVADVPENSTAIIGEARGRGEAKRYSIGDRLPGNATLEGVYDDHILLKRSGRVEKLRFSKDSLNGISATTGKANRGSARRPAGQRSSREASDRKRPAVRSLGKQAANPELSGVDSRGRGLGINNNPLFSGLQNQTEATIKQLGLASVDPAEGGGYLITNSAPPQLLNMLPVSVGDRILSVNGQALGNPSTDQALFQQVLSQESIQVELQKGDTRLTVDVNMSDLMGGRR